MTARAKHHVSGAPHREDRRDSHEVDQPLLLSEGGAGPRRRRALVGEDGRWRHHTGRLAAPRHASGGGGCRPRERLPRRARPRRDGRLLDRRVRAGDHVLLFGYEVPTRGTTRTVSLAADVHAATEVVDSSPGDGAEWAVLRLAAAAVGRLPLSVRRTGRIAVGEPLHVIGHPGGSARKTVLDLRAVGPCGPGSFVIDLQPFGGDCGAPVISSRSHLVEGVLVAGCGAARPGRRGTGERVTRIGELVHASPPVLARTGRAPVTRRQRRGDGAATPRRRMEVHRGPNHPA